MTHAFNPRPERQRQEDLGDFETSLVYILGFSLFDIVSSRPVRYTHSETCLNRNKQNSRQEGWPPDYVNWRQVMKCHISETESEDVCG